MRTTLTLDSDVSKMLETLQNEQGLSFKEAVNRALREGLYRLNTPEPGSSVQVHTFDLGASHFNLDDTGEALALTEGDDYR